MNQLSRLEKWIWLSEAITGGSLAGDKLLEAFGDVEKIYEAPREKCSAAYPRLRDATLSKLADKSLDGAREIIGNCAKKGIRIISRDGSEYPDRLRHIPCAPIVLYARGEMLDVDSVAAIAIVGTRDASDYGEKAAKLLGREVAEIGGIVVSGLAKGIDSFAMEAAFSAGGKCIAVLGCGVDIAYPRENRKLQEKTEKNGTVLSEYPPGTKPDKINFPRRNRIISGLSLGTVVVEAPEKSGALYTAKYALEQNRDVFAVPSGIFDERSAGTNRLIRDGAMPVSSGRDILSEYKHLFGDELRFEETFPEKKIDSSPKKEEKREQREDKKKEIPAGLSEKELAIVAVITDEARLADEIAQASGLPVSAVLTHLTMLEIRGTVKRLPGSRFILK